MDHDPALSQLLQAVPSAVRRLKAYWSPYQVHSPPWRWADIHQQMWQEVRPREPSLKI